MSPAPRVLPYTNALARSPRLSGAQQEHLNRHVHLVRRTEETEAARRERDQKAEAASRFRQQMTDCLPGMPEPMNRKTDMAIGRVDEDGDIVGVAGYSHLAKGSSVARFYARTHRLVRHADGSLMAHVELNCNAVDAARLRKALLRAQRFSLRQMQNAELKPCGWIHGAYVSDDSVASLQLMVTDRVALRKLATKTYSGCVITLAEDGDLADVSLIDAPADFLGVEMAKRRPDVIAKIYGGELMRKKAEKAARRADPDWAIAKHMARTTGRPRKECYAFAIRKRAAASQLRADPPALTELKRVDAAIRSGDIPPSLAKGKWDAAVAAAQIEQIRRAQRRPLYPGR